MNKMNQWRKTENHKSLREQWVSDDGDDEKFTKKTKGTKEEETKPDKKSTNHKKANNCKQALFHSKAILTDLSFVFRRGGEGAEKGSREKEKEKQKVRGQDIRPKADNWNGKRVGKLDNSGNKLL